MSKSKDGSKGRPNGTYDVGFGKPPRHTRWKKGQSGNPKGRKKGSRNMATRMREILYQSVVVRQNGVERRLPYNEALLTRIASKGLTGPMKDSLAVLKAINDYVPELLAEDPSTSPPQNITIRFVDSDGNGRIAPGQGLLPGEDPAEATWREVVPGGKSSKQEPERQTAGSDEMCPGDASADDAGGENEEPSQERPADDAPSAGDHGSADDDSWLD